MILGSIQNELLDCIRYFDVYEKSTAKEIKFTISQIVLLTLK
jgi:hypothetical protein